MTFINVIIHYVFVGPQVILSKNKLLFKILKQHDTPNIAQEVVDVRNYSTVDTIYQWLLPYDGHGQFQVCNKCKN